MPEAEPTLCQIESNLQQENYHAGRLVVEEDAPLIKLEAQVLASSLAARAVGAKVPLLWWAEVSERERHPSALLVRGTPQGCAVIVSICLAERNHSC
jgi:hypothetical protein